MKVSNTDKIRKDPPFSFFPHYSFIATEAGCGYNLMPQGLHSLLLQHSHPDPPSREGTILPTLPTKHAVLGPVSPDL